MSCHHLLVNNQFTCPRAPYSSLPIEGLVSLYMLPIEYNFHRQNETDHETSSVTVILAATVVGASAPSRPGKVTQNLYTYTKAIIGRRTLHFPSLHR